MHLVKLNLLRRISQVDQDFVSVIALLQGKAVVPEAMIYIDMSDCLVKAHAVTKIVKLQEVLNPINSS